MIFYIESSGFYETHAHETPVEVSHFDAKRQKLKHRMKVLMWTHHVDVKVIRKALNIVNAKDLPGVHDTDLLTFERVLDGISLGLGLSNE